MRTLRLLLVFIIVLFVFGILTGLNEESLISLKKGKNVVELNVTDFFYVKTLIKLNPDIEVVSYVEDGKSIGYVNLFSGIGDNFIVYEGEYEIIVSEDTGLILP